jgi:hypothetical protein
MDRDKKCKRSTDSSAYKDAFSGPSPGTPRGLFLLGTPRGVSPLIGDGPSLSLYTMLFAEALRLSA